MLQRVAVYCSMLQCVAVCCIVFSVLQRVAVCCDMLQCVAECCSALQVVQNTCCLNAVCCVICIYTSILHDSHIHRDLLTRTPATRMSEVSIAVQCSMMYCVAVRCNVLQCAAVCCSVLQCVTECCIYTLHLDL